MSKSLFRWLIITILILIIMINSVIALMLFRGAGYNFAWGREKKAEPQRLKFEVTEAGKEERHVNYNKINLNIQKGILEVFENMFIKEKRSSKIVKIRTN